VIHSEKMAIAIPRKSSLASSRNPRLRDFAGQTFLTFPRDRSPAHYDSLMRKFAQAGIEPAESAATASDSATLLGLVAAGLGFAIVPETFARYHQNEIVLRKIPELDMPFELQLVWSADNRDPLLLELVRAFEHPLPPDGH
jgi:DNA-binding transcriptional LysR family regulator